MKKWINVLVIILLLWLVSFIIVKSLKTNVDFGDKIAEIPIQGVITTEDGGGILFGQSTASSTRIVNYLEAASEDDNVKGIVLDINSPGGTVVASEEIANAVSKIKKPVTAYIREVGASGAYWVASAADTIVANPMSITGSVGVTGSYLEFSGLMDKYGVNYEELTAGEYKEMGSPYQKLSKEERAIMQNKLDQIHQFFIKKVVENRQNLPEETIKELNKGMFYLGQEAHQLKLVDYLGDKELAINLTKQKAGITEAKIISYEERKVKFLELLGKTSANAFYYIGRGIGYEIFNKDSKSYLEIEA